MPGLCSLAEAKAQLGKTSSVNDDELTFYIDAATAAIENYCGVIAPRTVTEWARPHGDTLVLRQQRVAAVTSVTSYLGQGSGQVFTAVTDPGSSQPYAYYLDAGGVLRRPFGQWWDGGAEIKVVYTAGFAEVPPALNLAARLVVQTMWRTRNGGAELPQLSDEPAVNLDGFNPNFPARALMLMAAYPKTPGMA